jgi:hypothetical protein
LHKPSADEVYVNGERLDDNKENIDPNQEQEKETQV